MSNHIPNLNSPIKRIPSDLIKPHLRTSPGDFNDRDILIPGFDDFFKSKFLIKEESIIASVAKDFLGGVISSSLKALLETTLNANELSAEDFTAASSQILMNSIEQVVTSSVTPPFDNFLTGYGGNLVEGILDGGMDFFLGFSRQLFKFSTGKISSEQLLAGAIESAMKKVTVGASVNVFTFIANTIGKGASIGASLGPLGAVIGGVVGSFIGCTIIGSAKSEGLRRFNSDIRKINLESDKSASVFRYIDVLGEMHKYRFSFKHLIPCYGTLGVLTEYGARKDALNAIKNELEKASNHIRDEYKKQLKEMQEYYSKVFNHIEYQFSAQREFYADSVREYQAALSQEVNQYIHSRLDLLVIKGNSFMNEMVGINKVNRSLKQQVDEIAELQTVVKDLMGKAELITENADRNYMLGLLKETVETNFLNKLDLPLRQAQIFFGVRE